MNSLANSIELMIEVIFENSGIHSQQMLGAKIKKFEENKSILTGNYTGNFGKLVEKLRRFNNNWNVTKHGMIVLGSPVMTIRKNGKFFLFDQKIQDVIDQEFSQIMKALIEISNKLSSK